MLFSDVELVDRLETVLDFQFSFHRFVFSMTSPTEFYGLYGAIVLFWSLFGFICGFKFKSARLQCWGGLLYVSSLPYSLLILTTIGK